MGFSTTVLPAIPRVRVPPYLPTIRQYQPQYWATVARYTRNRHPILTSGVIVQRLVTARAKAGHRVVLLARAPQQLVLPPAYHLTQRHHTPLRAVCIPPTRRVHTTLSPCAYHHIPRVQSAIRSVSRTRARRQLAAQTARRPGGFCCSRSRRRGSRGRCRRARGGGRRRRTRSGRVRAGASSARRGSGTSCGPATSTRSSSPRTRSRTGRSCSPPGTFRSRGRPCARGSARALVRAAGRPAARRTRTKLQKHAGCACEGLDSV
eukprot:1053704-Rhodomonas_salina.3